MTVVDLPRPAVELTPTPQSQNLARLRAMLLDESERKNWPDIQRAIEYLTATTVLGA